MMPWVARNSMPYAGLKAHSTAGFCATCHSPATAITVNQTSITGPKNVATLAVPRDWNANSSTRMSAVSGTTYGSNAGVMTLRPEHRQRWRDHGVAVEQCRADNAAQHDSTSALCQ